MSGVDVILCSPPYADKSINDHDSRENYEELNERVLKAGKGHGGTFGPSIGQSYGSSPGQLGAMRPGDTPEGSMTDTIEAIQWDGCYDLSYKGVITDASYSHPAKMSYGLLKRIFDHLFATGRLQRGSCVVEVTEDILREIQAEIESGKVQAV